MIHAVATAVRMRASQAPKVRVRGDATRFLPARAQRTKKTRQDRPAEPAVIEVCILRWAVERAGRKGDSPAVTCRSSGVAAAAESAASESTSARGQRSTPTERAAGL
eukprot:364667-Chlamydomonas_euryale.AAC.9